MYENAASIVFVVAIADYHKTMYEDAQENRLNDSLVTFEMICSHPLLLHLPLLLVFSKKDLLLETLQHYPLNSYFPNYEGGINVDEAFLFIKNLFISKVPTIREEVLVEFISCLNEQDIHRIFHIILNRVSSETRIDGDEIKQEALLIQ